MLNQIYLKKQILLQKYKEGKKAVQSDISNDKQNVITNLKAKKQSIFVLTKAIKQ